MTWSELITRLLTLGKTREEIATAIRDMVEAREISLEEGEARVDLLDRLVNLQNEPVMIIHTIHESIYEVDRRNKRVRRMMGAGNPTPRQGKDGEWRTYASIEPSPPIVGLPLLIVWDLKGINTPEGAPTTLTSTIKAINPPLS